MDKIGKLRFFASAILLLASITILLLAGKSFFNADQDGGQTKNQQPVVETPKNSGGTEWKYNVLSYYLPSSSASLNSMKQNIGSVDVVLGQFLGVDASGNVKETSSSVQSGIAFIRANSDKKVWALVNNYDHGWQGDRMAQVFADSTASGKLADSMLNYIRENKLDGVSLDFEGLPESSKPEFAAFVNLLKKDFSPYGLPVSVHVPADDNNYDYSGLAQAADYVIVMAYDEHNAATASGPISSIKWFKYVLDKHSGEIPVSKLIVGLGNYAYDWKEGAVKGTSLTTPSALAAAKQKNITLSTDTDSLNSHFDYLDAAGISHTVWLLDSVSAQYEIEALKDYKPAGVALFRFGSEDPYVWKVLR